MSDFDEGGDAPCWAHEFEDELFGDRTAGTDDDEQDHGATEDVG